MGNVGMDKNALLRTPMKNFAKLTKLLRCGRHAGTSI